MVQEKGPLESMKLSGLIYLSPFFLSLAVLVGLAIFIGIRRNQPGARPLSFVIVLAAFDIIAFIFELVVPSLRAKVFWDNLQYYCMIWMALAVLIFTFEYTGHKFHRQRLTYLGFSVLPLVASVLLLTNYSEWSIRSTARLVPGGVNMLLQYDLQFQDYLVSILLYLYLLISLIHFFLYSRKQTRIFRTQVMIISIGLLVPMVGGLMTLTGVEINGLRDFTPITYAISDLTLAYGIMRYALFQLTPVARQTVFEKISDPVFVIDIQGRILDLNPSAHPLLSVQPGAAVGQSLSSLLKDYCLPQTLAVEGDLFHPCILPVHGEQRHFEVRSVPLHNHNMRLSGWLVIFHDTTDRVLNEDLLLKNQEILEMRVKERTADLEAVNQLSIELANLPRDRDLDEFIATKFQQLTGAFVVWLSEYDPAKKQLLSRFLTVENRLLARVNAMMGKNMREMTMNLGDAEYREVLEQTILKKSTLAEATLGSIPPVIGAGLESAFNVEQIIILAIAHQGILMGTAAFILQKDKPMPSDRLLTAFSPIAAIALRKRKGDLALERYMNRMEILHQIDHSILTSLSSQTIAEAALTGIQRLIPLDRAAVFLRDPATGQHQALAMMRAREDPICPWFVESKVNEVMGDLNPKEFLLVDDTRQSPLTYTLCSGCAFEKGHSLLIIRMHAQENDIGALHLCSSVEQAFTEENLEIAQEIANQLAIAISQSDLLTQTEKALDREKQLNEITRSISRVLDLDATIPLFLQLASHLVEADGSALALLSDDGEALLFRDSYFHPVVIGDPILPKGQGVSWIVVESGQSILIPHYADHPAAIPAWVEARLQTLIVAPVIAAQKVLGVLVLYRTQDNHAFNPRDLELAEAISRQAGLAIRNMQLFTKVQLTSQELAEAYDAIIAGWAKALELRDKETRGHSDRVTHMAVDLAKQMGFTEDALVDFRRGVFLHDIGKMGIPDSILLKPGPLTSDEWIIMRKHPDYAYQLLSGIAYLRPALDIPYCHHEKWDGSGYPRGLKGEAIPLGARIFAVVDVWDALTSERPYRPAWSEEETWEYLRQKAGADFDPRVVKAFLEMTISLKS
jgi:HD-GYP domain-containing protein (c-di-GMP phosphodiesterase class II)/PAS domain-containing protein